jgi:hypothetical protein
MALSTPDAADDVAPDATSDVSVQGPAAAVPAEPKLANPEMCAAIGKVLK